MEGGLSFYWTGAKEEARTWPLKARKEFERKVGRDGRGGRALPSGGPRTPRDMGPQGGSGLRVGGGRGSVS
jgi:hypothetical protein